MESSSDGPLTEPIRSRHGDKTVFRFVLMRFPQNSVCSFCANGPVGLISNASGGGLGFNLASQIECDGRKQVIANMRPRMN